MLKRLEDFCGFIIQGKEGEIGKITDFYFDDKLWEIRYMVVELKSRQPAALVLLSPRIIESADGTQPRFFTNLLMKKIENSPPWNQAEILSRTYETLLNDYYGWQPYWIPEEPEARERISELYSDASESYFEDETHLLLRSARDVSGYHIEALDGSLGHADDFIADTLGWKVRYMVVDTSHWIPGRKVLIATDWIEGMDWEESKVYVSLDKESIRKSPGYDAGKLDRHYERQLYRYYGRKRYWEKARYRKSA